MRGVQRIISLAFASRGLFLLAWAGEGEPHVQAAFRGANGELAFTRLVDGNQDIYAVMPGGGEERRITRDPAIDADPAWSPDGQRLAFARYLEAQWYIYVINQNGTGERRVTSVAGEAPSWAPDGRRIAFSGPDGMYMVEVSGRGLRKLGAGRSPAWSPDGSRIAFVGSPANDIGLATTDIWVMNPDGSNPVALTDDPAYDRAPEWSPDGSMIAFQSNRDDRRKGLDWKIYTMRADGSEEARLTGRDDVDEQEPAWAPDGNSIAFLEFGLRIWHLNSRRHEQVAGGQGYAGPSWQPVSGMPRLLLPGRGAVVQKPFLFDWTEVDGANAYRLRICLDRGCGAVVRRIRGTDSDAVISRDLRPGKYFWRVQAITEGGAERWSPGWGFWR